VKIVIVEFCTRAGSNSPPANGFLLDSGNLNNALFIRFNKAFFAVEPDGFCGIPQVDWESWFRRVFTPRDGQIWAWRSFRLGCHSGM
jgi:hypothetical protein